MEILLWLVPPVLVTVIAMAWVGWVERETPPVDRQEQVRRIGDALRTPAQGGYAVREPRTPDRSSGVAVRRTRSPGPRPADGDRRAG